jgi:hypothetical protein
MQATNNHAQTTQAMSPAELSKPEKDAMQNATNNHALTTHTMSPAELNQPEKGRT